jgi:3-phenylpropionate/cinnamic acid dioxygenase small subunit
MLDRVSQLNAEYARAIDDDRLEDWPGFFTDPCLYSITSRTIIAGASPRA